MDSQGLLLQGDRVSIFLYVSVHRLMFIYRGILRVCKGWNHFLRGIPSLWMDVNLTGARTRVPWTSVRDYIHQSKVALTHANIHNVVPAATPKVLDMLSRCPHLEHLELWVPHDNPAEFYAKIKNFKRLKTLVCSDVKISHACVGGILSGLPLLEKAAFYNVWETRQDSASTWPEHLPNLKSLTIGSSYRDPTRPFIPFTSSAVVPRLGSVSFCFFIARCQYMCLPDIRSHSPLIPIWRNFDLSGTQPVPSHSNLSPWNMGRLFHRFVRWNFTVLEFNPTFTPRFPNRSKACGTMRVQWTIFLQAEI